VPNEHVSDVMHWQTFVQYSNWLSIEQVCHEVGSKTLLTVIITDYRSMLAWLVCISHLCIAAFGLFTLSPQLTVKHFATCGWV